MGKKEKLSKIHKAVSDSCYENMALLDNLISNAQTCPPSCVTLLEMVRNKTENAFNKIEKSRKVLNILD